MFTTSVSFLLCVSANTGSHPTPPGFLFRLLRCPQLLLTWPPPRRSVHCEGGFPPPWCGRAAAQLSCNL